MIYNATTRRSMTLVSALAALALNACSDGGSSPGGGGGGSGAEAEGVVAGTISDDMIPFDRLTDADVSAQADEITGLPKPKPRPEEEAEEADDKPEAAKEKPARADPEAPRADPPAPKPSESAAEE